IVAFWATANPGVPLERVEKAFWQQIGQLREEGGQPAELERVLTGIEARQLISLQQFAERADQLSMFTTFFDEPERINTELDEYRGVTTDDVNALVRDRLDAENSVVLRYLPLARSEEAA